MDKRFIIGVCTGIAILGIITYLTVPAFALYSIPPTPAFRIINSTSGNVTALSYNDFVELIAGAGITININNATNEITFSASSGINTVESLTNVTDTGCAVNQIRKVNSTGWYICSDDAGFLGDTPWTVDHNANSFILDNVKKINDDGTHFNELGVFNLANNKNITWNDDGGTSTHKIGVDTSGFMRFEMGENEPFAFVNNFGAAGMRLTSTFVSGTANSPFFLMNRNFAPTVSNTDMGLIIFRGQSNLGNTVDYARIRSFGSIITDGIEEGAWNLQVAKKGVDNVNAMSLNHGGFGSVGTNNNFNLTMASKSFFRFDTAGTANPSSSDTWMSERSANNLHLSVGGDLFKFNTTYFDIGTNQIAGSMSCSNGQFIVYNSTSNKWVCRTANTVYKLADETINSDSTLTDDNNLQFAVAANKKYSFHLQIWYDSDVIPGFKVAFSVPSGATGIRTNGALALENKDAQATITTAYSMTVANTNLKSTEIMGWIDNGANAGTVAFQWAQGVSNAANTKLYKGSWLEYKQLN